MNLFGDFNNTMSLFGEAGKQAAEEQAKAKEKKEKKTKVTKPKKGTSKASLKLKGAITIVSQAFRYVVENDGEMDVVDALKAAFAEGYKEVAVSRITQFDNTLLIDPFGADPEDEDVLVEFVDDKLIVPLGQHRVELTPEMFDMDREEISVYDLARKYAELNPAFKGCRMSVAKGVAVPTFSQEVEKDKLPERLSVYKNNSVVEMTKEAFLSEMPADDEIEVVFLKSQEGVYFPSIGSGTKVSVIPGDFDLKTKGEKAAEKYRLPFTLRLTTFNTTRELTSDDFGGKRAVTKEELIDYLKTQKMKVFQQERGFEVYYDAQNNIVSIALVSGKKGAEIIEHPSFKAYIAQKDAIDRIFATVPTLFGFMLQKFEVMSHETEIGTFFTKWTARSDSTPAAVEFANSKLPKVPVNILHGIIQEFRRDLTRESMVWIMWNRKMKEFYAYMPQMETSKVSIAYDLSELSDLTEDGDQLFMAIHSHNTMPAFWSNTDNEDESRYYGLFGVIGRLDTDHPQIRIRCGVEGCFKELSLSDVFEGV